MPEKENKICAYPRCNKCEFDYCIKDGVISQEKPPKTKDRSEYNKRYYKKHLEEIRSKYNTKTKYLKYITVRSVIRKLSKQIGSVNVQIVLDAIEQIEKE